MNGSGGAMLALGAVLGAVGLAACGGHQTQHRSTSRSAAAAAAAQTSTSTTSRAPNVKAALGASVAAQARRTGGPEASLTPQQRRAANDLAKRFSKQIAKAPRGEVADSGVIP